MALSVEVLDRRCTDVCGIPIDGLGDTRTASSGRAGELALVQRCRDGDVDAKRLLLQRVLPVLHQAVTTLLGPGADADDAVQQAAIDVLRGLGSFRGESNLAAWARTVAVRAGLKSVRHRSRHLSAVDPETLPAPPIADAAFTESIPQSIESYLRQLPPVQREALVLRHGLGCTVPEISELLGVPVNTVKSRLLHGRREVRRCIRRDEAIGAKRPGEAL
ncbi:MAG: sigma-70 family RNA polymerase sigma factor [Nannocystaceae bacterium]|nr:sigma-70 family RNA polymerase sigma factor [Nannocystaceae bacterium]